MSRLRWPDSTNSVSDDPGTVQNPTSAQAITIRLTSLGEITPALT